MRTVLCIAMLTLAAPTGPLTAQEGAGAAPPAAVGARRFTLALGIGNTFGWFGGQAEAHVARERVSLVAGLGYTPSVDTGDPSGVTAAAGIRGFTRGENHRGFLELGISQVAVTSYGGFDDADGERHYGPGVQLGYQYVADRGFTFLAAAGYGWALGLEPELGQNGGALLLGIGIGYTWR